MFRAKSAQGRGEVESVVWEGCLPPVISPRVSVWVKILTPLHRNQTSKRLSSAFQPFWPSNSFLLTPMLPCCGMWDARFGIMTMLCSRRDLWESPVAMPFLQPLKRAEAVRVETSRNLTFSGDKDQTTGFTAATPSTPKPRAEIAPHCSWGHAAGFN
jgi:hypothetical protein